MLAAKFVLQSNDVIRFNAAFNLTNFVNWVKPEGTAVSVLLLKSNVSTGAVVETLAKIGGMASLPRP